MAKKLVSRTAKVLSETKKTKDNEAVAIAYEHIPRNPDELNHGSIYSVIEIEDKSGRAEEIAEKIIDVLHDSFYENLDIEPLEAFESSLAKINEELTDRSSEGQINWLGKLNAVLAIVSKNTLHVTQTGKAEAYLYRGDHTMQITEDLAGDSINPQRTFINIASGDLSEKDKVAFVTPGVFYKISKTELKKFTTASSPKIATENISKLLSGENGTVKPNAVLLMEMVSPESFAANDESIEPSEAWVKEERDKAQEISAGITGSVIKVFGFIGTAFAALSLSFKTKSLPALKSGFSKLKTSIDDLRKDKDKEKVILESEEKISSKKIPEPNSETEIEIDTDDGILEAPFENNREIRIKESRKKPKLISVERFDFSFLKNLKENIGSLGKKTKLSTGKRSYIYLGAGIFLLASIIFYYGYMGNIKEARSEAETKINQASQLYEESLTEIANGNYQLASSNLETAEELALEVSKSNYFTTEANELLAQINGKKDEANRITRNTASLFYEFDTNISQVLTNGTLVYAIDFETGTIHSVDPLSGATAKIAENPQIDGNIEFTTLIASRNTLVAYTDQNELYEVNLDNGNLEKQNVSGGLEKSKSIDFFGTNIYLLSPEKSQIFRHFKITRGYGQKADYFPSPQTLTNTVDFAIDGSVYLVDSSANISKFTSGAEESFQATNLPKEYNDIKGIYTKPEINSIYLYTDQLIIKLNKNGEFIAQYANNDAKKITNLFELNGKVFFSSNSKVYTLDN